MNTKNASHPIPEEFYDLEFWIDRNHNYAKMDIRTPHLLLLESDSIIGNHFTAHLPEKYKTILEHHYTELNRTKQTQIYRYQMLDPDGDLRQMLGVMSLTDQDSVRIRVYDLTQTRSYSLINDPTHYQESLQQIRAKIESVDRISSAMSKVLSIIAHFCGADRVFFSLLSDDGTRVESVEEFDPRDNESDKHLYLGIETKAVPWLMKQLYSGQSVRISDVRALPKEAFRIQQLLMSGGTIADLVVPIAMGGKLIGVIGCDSITHTVDWTDTQVRFLKEVGEYLLGRAYLRQIKNELSVKNIEFATLLRSLPHPIFMVNQTGLLMYANEAFHDFFSAFFGNTGVEVHQGSDFAPIAKLLGFTSLFHERIIAGVPLTEPLLMNRTYSNNDEMIQFQIQVVPVKTGIKANSFLVIFIDLTELLQSQDALTRLQNRLKTAIEANRSFVYEWNVKDNVVTSNGHLDSPHTNLQSNMEDILTRVHPNDRAMFKSKIESFIMSEDDYLEFDFRTRIPSGEFKWVSNNGRVIERAVNGTVDRFIGTITDISERKRYEMDVQFLASHDLLTELKNRNAFESFTAKESTADRLLVIADMDGLKPINDNHGHQMGDQALKQIAVLLKENFHEADFIGRIGGDEFAIILPKLRREEMSRRILQIKKVLASQSSLPMETNLSMGYAYSRKGESFEAMFQRAEDRMYKDKLTNRTSSKASVVLSLMKSLQEKNVETESHCNRVEDFSVAIATRMRLDFHLINELRLLSKLHDIGKIAIPMQLLTKPDKLSDEEWMLMQQHPEIGARIVSASPNMESIADGILHHHERWDGLGYPNRLKETEIPLVARIICVVDAYDAMTSLRPYGKVKTNAEAITELKRCSGTQFDPFLVELFIDILQSKA